MRTLVLLVLCLSLLFNVWLARAAVRLEGYRHASQLGMCGEGVMSLGSTQREQCLADAQTRSWPWHLYYALGGQSIVR